jgi:hypothetical protein
VDGVVGVLDDVDIDAIGHLDATLGEDGLGVGHEAGLQGVILPARGEQVGKGGLRSSVMVFLEVSGESISASAACNQQEAIIREGLIAPRLQ